MGIFSFGKPKDEVLENKIQKLNQEIELKKKSLDELKLQIQTAKEICSLNEELANKRSELDRLNHEISLANDDLGLQEFGFFNRQYKFTDSLQYKEALENLRLQEKELVKNDNAAKIIWAYTFNNSEKKGRAIQNKLKKVAIRGFNGEADALLVKATPANVENKKTALIRSFDQLNKIYASNGVEISPEYLQLKLLREQREKEREDKKLQAEIKAKRKQLEKDRDHFKNMVAKVTELLKEAKNDEVDELRRQLTEYQDKLSELDEIEEDIDYREGHATAGYVYVISNIGSFGEDVYKIGVTRRLEPLERIRELSSASVPFQFDVHALIFSEEAFALETELHNQLANYKVNKVNGRKEYFKVPFDKIKSILASHKELTVELNENAEAFEYRQTKAIEDKQL